MVGYSCVFISLMNTMPLMAKYSSNGRGDVDYGVDLGALTSNLWCFLFVFLLVFVFLDRDISYL